MDLSFWNNKKCRYGIIGGAVLLLTVIALAIRLLPMADLLGTGDMIAGPDGWYNLRLVEVLLASGGYIFFDPMTLFPTGQEIVWGPLFTYIAAFFGIIGGAASGVELVNAVSWTPAIMGALMVPVMFFLGKKLGDWKTGLLAGLFIAIIGGQFFSRSLYGHFDHHVAETLFTTLFVLCYILGVVNTHGKEISWKNMASLKMPIILGVVSGIAYLLSLLTMSTMLLFGLFAAIFTLIQFILDVKSKRPTEYLVIINTLTFGIAAIGLLMYGIREMSFDYSSYSLGLFVAQILVIIATICLYALQKGIEKLEKPWYMYLVSIAVVAVIGIIVVWIALPDLFNSIVSNLSNSFWNSTGGASTVQELSPWSLDSAMASFNWGLLLAIGGFVVLLIQVIRKENPAALFVVVWSALMFFITAAHIRWEYLFAANVALLAAVCVAWAISFAANDLKKFVKKEHPVETSKKKGKAAPAASAKSDPIRLGVFAVIIVVAVAFVGVSTVSAVSTASVYGQAGGTEKDWISSCEWLVENTPETGIDYNTIYEEEGFEYPEEAYGIMSWWDYGHYITTIGERIPNTNPFQAGVWDASHALTATSENEATSIFDRLGTKYVMTDYQMAGSKFGAMAIWADGNTDEFYTYMLQQSQNGQLSTVTAQSEEFYNTLTVRLQHFDGSYTEAGSVLLILTDNSAGYGYPVITYTKVYQNADDAWKVANEYNAKESNTNAGKYAYVISYPSEVTDSFDPNADVAALKHFRIVHESETYLIPIDSYSYYQTEANEGGTAWVKTFEYVEGAVIKGNGIISIDVTTNNGRTFTYRQESENGQFVVPYATGQTGEIKTGVYKIEGTGQTFTVSEEAVQKGLTIN